MLALSVWRTSALVRHLGRFDLGQAKPCKRRHFASNKKKRMLLLSLVSKHQSVPFAPPIGNAPSLNAAFSSASRSRLNPLAISRGLRLVIAFDACASEFSDRHEANSPDARQLGRLSWRLRWLRLCGLLALNASAERGHQVNDVAALDAGLFGCGNDLVASFSCTSSLSAVW